MEAARLGAGPLSKHAPSHPPTLLTIAKRTLERECGPLRGERILVAVSGGRDSMALLHVMARLREKLGFELVAAGVDHGLREHAASELAIAADLAARIDVEFSLAQVTVERGGNLQARARAERLAALERTMELTGATLLATAHHADDRAETVLIRVLRGASAAGLAVLPPRDGSRIRPLIRATRAAIDSHVARHAVPFSDDPSNADPRYLRTRVRQSVLPALRELDRGIVDHLCSLADDMVELAPGARSVALEAEPDGARATVMRELERAAHGARAEAGNSLQSPRPLPRASRTGLALLERNRSDRMRVLLPGGRVARFDRERETVVIEPDLRRSAAKRSGR